MNFSHLRALALLCVLSLASQQSLAASEATLNGWQSLTWGMTKPQVLKVMPEARDYSVEVSGKAFPQFGLEKYDIADCTMQANFDFDDQGKLSRVVLSSPKELPVTCGYKLRTLLAEKYGKALKETAPRSNSPAAQVTWSVQKTNIDLSVDFFSGINRTVVYIKYQARDTSGAAKL